MRKKKENKIKQIQNNEVVKENDAEIVKSDESKVVKSRIVRVLIFTLGFISFVLGTIGIFLPILPTTPLYLLASFCFVRSSAKFNTWFLNSNLYKNHLENFATTRAMIVKNEIFLLLFVSTILLITIFTVNKLAVTIILTILIVIKYSYFVFRVTPISRDEFDVMQENRKKEKAMKKVLKEAKENA